MGVRPVVLGRITGLFGVSGWVKVYSFTQPTNEILVYSPWYIGDGLEKRVVLEARPHGKTLIAHIADRRGEPLTERDSAAPLVGCDIAVDRQQLAELPGDQYYWCDLVGSTVYNRAGVRLGTVASMLETGAHDVMVLNAERERLVPFVVGPIVESVDASTGRIDVDWPEDA